MFKNLGTSVARFWYLLLIAWGAALFVLASVAPDWQSVVEDGEFAFLPDDAPSRQGEELFQAAFPDDLLASTVVIVVRRETHATAGLTEADREFVTQTLKPALLNVAKEEGGLAVRQQDAETAGGDSSIIAQVRTFEDGPVGQLLDSPDGKATLVIVELTTEFQARRNASTIAKIEDVVERLRRAGPKTFPPGLDLAVGGSATVGRDMKLAAEESADATELWTVILVVFLLVVIYRAPLLALIPLATVASAVTISLKCLALMGRADIVELFLGIEIYVTVLVYGAGVDYCLFLIARYKEELDAGESYAGAVEQSLGKVGAALTASAGTVMCGIGMMYFAEFGKFQQAGVAITFSLAICLCAALTLTPSLLRLCGRWAFWPYVPQEHAAANTGWLSTTSLLATLLENIRFDSLWKRVGQALLVRPATIWGATIAVMVPFAVIGVAFYSHLTYGLLDELPRNDPSVVGAEAIQAHFPAGATGIVTLLINHPDVDFSRRTEGGRAIEELTNELNDLKDTLRLDSVRSVSHPLATEEGIFGRGSPARQAASFAKSRDFYVSKYPPHEDHVTRLDFVFRDDPFSRNSIADFVRLNETVEQLISDNPSLREATLLYKGPTASMLDLKRTTDRDQIRIDILVLIGVFLILVVLLKTPAICTYLIVSVFFSYFVTLGVTIAVFWALDPHGFAGLDWKVPMFLFTILIAVGEDYNIFLMTRIEEEQLRFGPTKGVIVALERTGSIISSCGVIMAGTFSSLLAGSLVGMHQLGFALAFGVLLDTFVVRPILVPSYLVMLHSGRFGPLGRLLGAQSQQSVPAAEAGVAEPIQSSTDQ